MQPDAGFNVFPRDGVNPEAHISGPDFRYPKVRNSDTCLAVGMTTAAHWHDPPAFRPYGAFMPLPALLLHAHSCRLRRRSFLGTSLCASAVFVVLFVFVEGQLGHGATLALYPPFWLVIVFACAARMRDRGRSPFWLVLILVPVLGPAWLAVELLFRGGTEGVNQYGPDPRTARADYLTVE